MSAKSKAPQGKKNSLTKEIIESRIKDIEFVTVSIMGKRFMFCFIEMKSGFIQVGKPSVCMDDDNFNNADGKAISYENSFEELWKLEAYKEMAIKG